MCRNIHSSFTCNRQKQNTTQISISGSMTTLVHSGIGIPFKNSKEWATDTLNTCEPQRHYLSRRVHTTCFPICEVLEQRQCNYGDKWQNRGYLWGGGYWLERDMRKMFRGKRNVLYFNLSVGYIARCKS